MGYGLPSKQLVSVISGGAREVVEVVTSLCRERLTIRPGYEFGYFVGATCADGTVGRNYVSLVANEERFAARYADCLTRATGVPARLEPVTRPSLATRTICDSGSLVWCSVMRPRSPDFWMAMWRATVTGSAGSGRRELWSVATYRSCGNWQRSSAPGSRPVEFRDGFHMCTFRMPGPGGGTFEPEDHPLERGAASTRRRNQTVHPLQLPSRSLPGSRQATGSAPVLLWSSSSGSLQTRSRKRAATMTAMPARTEKPA